LDWFSAKTLELIGWYVKLFGASSLGADVEIVRRLANGADGKLPLLMKATY
jgi:hypothetical protein